MWKQDHSSVNLNPNVPVQANRVETICLYAGISAEEFERMRGEVADVVAEETGGAAVLLANELLPHGCLPLREVWGLC